MGASSAISGGLTAGYGIYSAIQAGKEKRQAKNALENYKRQQLEGTNIAKDLQVSTLGADRQLAEQSRLASTQIGALQDAGTRAIIAGSGRVEAGNQAVNQQVTADLDQQQERINQMIAEDDARIRSMQENRENADINALSSQYQAGKQDQNMAIGNIVQGIGSVANQFGPATANQNPQVEAVSNVTPAGIVPSSGITPTPLNSNYLRNPQFNYGGVGMMKPRNRFVNSNF